MLVVQGTMAGLEFQTWLRTPVHQCFASGVSVEVLRLMLMYLLPKTRGPNYLPWFLGINSGTKRRSLRILQAYPSLREQGH